MIYTDFKGLQLSQLGFGLMRLPTLDDDPANIDIAATEEMVDYALDHGINYFDTAWGYHMGNSETVLGNALKRHPRDSYHIATKWPGYDVSNFGKAAEIFERQLEKLDVEFFDFYLAHNICSTNIDQYLDDETYHTISYLLEQRDAGRIKHFGISAHATYDELVRFMDVFGDEVEFVQLQLNYMDWTFQDDEHKVAYLNKRGIPIWVMEPLRGGTLVELTDEQVASLEALRPDETPVAWAFRYLQSLDGIGVILSGMSSLEQMKQNIETFETSAPLNDEEMHAIYHVADEIIAGIGVPCTACRYCTDHCPQQLDIPELLALYNENLSKDEANRFIAPMAVSKMPDDKKPNACIGCGSCVAVCPQLIDIPDALAKFSEMLGLK